VTRRLLFLLGACRPAPAPVDGLSQQGLTAQNIVLIHVDTLRADHLAAYGYERSTLPLLESRPWVVVDGYHSATSWTAPSSASMLTGLEIHHHNVRYWDSSGPGAPINQPLDAPTFAAHLSSLGWHTGLASGNTFVSEVTSLSNGFAHRTDDPTAPPNSAFLAEDLLAWLDTVPPGEPFLLMMQPMDAHQPWDPLREDHGTWSAPDALPFDIGDPQDKQLLLLEESRVATDDAGRGLLRQAVRDIYDEQLLGLDRSVAALLDGLDARGRLDDTLVVISADHGESLDDLGVGVFGHGGSLRQELVRVPLMLSHASLPAGTEDCLSQNIDLFPTLLRALGLPPLLGIDGVALQDGCRPYATSSLYNAGHNGTGELDQISAVNRDVRVTVECMGNRLLVFDLATDPTCVSAMDPHDVSGTGDLRGPLLDLIEDIRTELPDTTCDIANTLPRR
jgi:arylsulfatase A-like enzyme